MTDYSWEYGDWWLGLGSPAWWKWHGWNGTLDKAMKSLGLDGPYWLCGALASLPQDCETTRHYTELKEQLIGEAWENRT